MKQLNRFVTCTEPFAVGQAQGAALWGQECHRSPAQEVWRAWLQHPSPGIDGSCAVSSSPAGLGPVLESCIQISPKHPPSSMASPLQRVPGSQITDLGHVCPLSAASHGHWQSPWAAHAAPMGISHPASPRWLLGGAEPRPPSRTCT